MKKGAISGRNKMQLGAAVQVRSGDGARLKSLMLESQNWIHRRVDTLKLGAEGPTRRNVSLEMTIPKRLAINGSPGKILVPLAVIEKARLRDVDTSDRDGKTLPILGTKDNGTLAKELLSELVPEWIHRDGQLQSVSVADRLPAKLSPTRRLQKAQQCHKPVRL